MFHRNFFTLVCAAILAAVLPIAAIAASDDIYNTGYYEFTVSDEGEAAVVGFDPNVSVAYIPPAFNGYPVTSIAPGAFLSHENLMGVSIPGSITNIGDNAFADCTGLMSIIFNEGLISIGDSAFFNCVGLTNITIPNSVTSIGDEAFFYCINLINLTLSKNLTKISASTFAFCESLRSVTIPDGVTSIESEAFSYCVNLSVTIPKSVKNIAGDAFFYCENTTIYGYAGSYAQAYAANNYIDFVVLNPIVTPPADAPVITAPEILNKNAVLVKVSNFKGAEAKLYAGVYNGNRLVEVKILVVRIGGEYIFIFDNDISTYDIKIMLWGDELTPLTAPKTKSAA